MTAYTTAQAEAIACVDKPLQIIACAGSGKTQVISQRISNILALDGVGPKNVVAFTFTEKAAAELKERVLRIVEEDGVPTTGIAEMYIGTMHAFCLNLLQTFVPETFKMGVLTDVTQQLFIDRNSKASGLTTCPTSSPGTPTLKRYTHSKRYGQVLSVLDEDEVNLDLVPRGVIDSYNHYQVLSQKHAFLDYTAMLALAVDFLENVDGLTTPAHLAVGEYVTNAVKYVVVDEYQDVNPLQERLVRALVQHGANLCVVGDDDQTIYQWRGSDVGNILAFSTRYEGVEQVTLAENFRSTEGIVALGRTIAEQIPEGARLAKKMEHASHQKWERGDILGLEFDSPDAEAAWICDRIEAMRGVPIQDTPGAEPRGLSWSDFSVLFRSVSADAGPLVREFDRRKIRYVVKGLTRLFESREIEAVVGLFQYMVGELTAEELTALWKVANLVPKGARFSAVLSLLDKASDFERGDRWGTYNIQRVYLDALEVLGLREDTVPGDAGRGELVFYQLGKFSQVISDFETINFSSSPRDKYDTFVGWLRHHAPAHYDESDADVGYATPNAVTISTVHRAKGMQWPVVFVPCMRRNRFPSQRWGGLRLDHVIPDAALKSPDRYKGSREDELRLYYVAVTRAQKYLYVTYSPGEGRNFKKRSEFFDLTTAVAQVSTDDQGAPGGERLPSIPRQETPQVTLSFSELKYFFECPYQFKLRFMYGFNPPLHEALGYGKGLHDALAEMHKRALAGDLLDASFVGELVGRHLHTPYAYPALRAQLEAAAVAALERYFKLHGDDLENTIHSEQQIQVHIAPGITVDGRIDLVKRLVTNEVSIVDFKSTVRAQAEEVTRDQLHVYAVGFQELTGAGADLIEVLNLDEQGKNTREPVREVLLAGVRVRIREAGEALRVNNLPPHARLCGTCGTCDLKGLCRTGAS